MANPSIVPVTQSVSPAEFAQLKADLADMQKNLEAERARRQVTETLLAEANAESTRLAKYLNITQMKNQIIRATFLKNEKPDCPPARQSTQINHEDCPTGILPAEHPKLGFLDMPAGTSCLDTTCERFTY